MAKFVCTVCGYVYEGEAAPAECPICHAPAEKFVKQEGDWMSLGELQREQMTDEDKEIALWVSDKNSRYGNWSWIFRH